MNCPVCQVPLRMTDRQGIEIDYCPQCRGVWLGRGELDKIIERSVTPAFRGDDDDDIHESRRYGEGDEYRRRRRGSFLGDLFDFG